MSRRTNNSLFAKITDESMKIRRALCDINRTLMTERIDADGSLMETDTTIDQQAAFLLYTDAMFYVEELHKSFFNTSPIKEDHPAFRDADWKIGFTFEQPKDHIDETITSTILRMKIILEKQEVNLPKLTIVLTDETRKFYDVLRGYFLKIKKIYDEHVEEEPDLPEPEVAESKDNSIQDLVSCVNKMHLNKFPTIEELRKELENDTDPTDKGHENEFSEASTKSVSSGSSPVQLTHASSDDKNDGEDNNSTSGKRLKNVDGQSTDKRQSSGGPDGRDEPDLGPSDDPETIAKRKVVSVRRIRPFANDSITRRPALHRQPASRGIKSNDSGAATPKATDDDSGAATPKATDDDSGTATPKTAQQPIATDVMPALSEADLWHAISKLTAHVERLVA